MYLRCVPEILYIILLGVIRVALALSDPDRDYNSVSNIERTNGDGLNRLLRSDSRVNVGEIDSESDINEDRIVSRLYFVQLTGSDYPSCNAGALQSRWSSLICPGIALYAS
ncbi:RxLR effector protein [Phytophthora megakarya]|uniref:RxLR effector protein n=1 Tax=Phytophthora megakarya TaxID=4795 RepID=A0A225WDQ2_9STRA|nr:RxLR effector protein [Phytophthora megakarya]